MLQLRKAQGRNPERLIRYHSDIFHCAVQTLNRLRADGVWPAAAVMVGTSQAGHRRAMSSRRRLPPARRGSKRFATSATPSPGLYALRARAAARRRRGFVLRPRPTAGSDAAISATWPISDRHPLLDSGLVRWFQQQACRPAALTPNTATTRRTGRRRSIGGGRCGDSRRRATPAPRWQLAATATRSGRS